MSRSVPSANSRGVALLSAAFALTACTSILGIDGNYYSETSSGGSAGGGKTNESGGKSSSITPKTGGAAGLGHHDAGISGSGGAAGSGNAPSSGGFTQDASIGSHTNHSGGTDASGGSPSSGGHKNGETGGTSASGGSDTGGGGEGGSGGTPPEDTGAPICPLGTFMGTYSGKHHPSTGITAVAAQITGSIRLVFTATTSPTVRAITGGVAFLPTMTSGGFAGTFLGNFDCEAQAGTVSLIDPSNVTTVVPPEVDVPIDGTFQIQPGPNGELKGTFSIHETLNLAATGSGTWATD